MCRHLRRGTVEFVALVLDGVVVARGRLDLTLEGEGVPRLRVLDADVVVLLVTVVVAIWFCGSFLFTTLQIFPAHDKYHNNYERGK